MWPEADEQEATQAAERGKGVLEVAELVLSTTLDYFLCLDSGDPINPGNPGAPASHTKEQVLQFSPYTPGSCGCDACSS